jgi:hypothetical protein
VGADLQALCAEKPHLDSLSIIPWDPDKERTREKFQALMMNNTTSDMKMQMYLGDRTRSNEVMYVI